MGAGVERSGSVAVGGRSVGSPSAAGQVAAPYNYPVRFDRDEFTAALKQHGHDVIWYKAAYCPNRQGPDLIGDHDIACTLCDGHGFIAFDPIETRMLVQGIGLTEHYYYWGRYDSGNLMVTALPEYRLHYWDRIYLVNGVARFSEIRRRQRDTDTDALKYCPISLLYLSYVDRDGVLQRLDPDIDVVITAAGGIQWLRSYPHRPDSGQMYTVSYLYHPTYIIMDLVHQHRNDRVDPECREIEFPVQATARLDFLVRRESEDRSEAVDQSPFPGRSEVRR